MTTARRVARDQVLAFRLDGHNLVRRRPPGELLAVAGACGIRNTPPGSAVLALHARLDGLEPGSVERALADRLLVEVLSMRISPCLVPARDVAVFTLGALPADEASLRATLNALAASLDEGGISAADAVEQTAVAARAELVAGPLTRDALSAAITARLPDALGPWCQACKSRHVGESLFRLAGVRGAFVIARDGKNSLYVRADQWLRAAPDGDPGAARAELLRRYLACYGPSTADHFAAWVGVGAAEARRDWERLTEQLVAVELDGRRAWLHAADLARLDNPPTPTGVRLLPPYDAYLDQRDRATLLPDKDLQPRVWRAIGNPGALLADGQLVGLWRPQKKGKRLLVAVETFTLLTPAASDAVEAEAALIAPHRGCVTAEVTFAD